MMPCGRFRNAYELINLGAFKYSLLNKLRIFQCTCEIFCVEFQRVPLKFNTKYLSHTLNDMMLKPTTSPEKVYTIVWGGCGLTGTWAGLVLYSQVIIRPYLNQFWDRILPPYIRTLGLNELTFYSRMWKLVLLAPFWENCCGPCTLCCAILHKSWIKWQTFSRRYFQMHSRW